MISKVLDLLRGDLTEDSEEDSVTVKKSRNPFAFLDEQFEDGKDETEDISVEEAHIDSPEDLFEEIIKDTKEEKKESGSSNGVPVDEVERVCHKVEFCEKIICNDGVRAKLEIKNIVADLKDLIRGYS